MRRSLSWLRVALFGRSPNRPPIDGPHDLHRYLDALAEKAGKAASTVIAGQLATGAKEVTIGTFEARQQRRTRRRRARAARIERRASPHPVEWLGDRRTFFDPLVARVGVYLLSFGAFVTALESTGTYASLAVFDGVLGEFRGPLAIASGAILFLSGHACGHLLFSAVKARGLARKTSLGVVAVLIAAAVLAICWTGIDRSANEEARAKGKQASTLVGVATGFDNTALKLETPLPVSDAKVEKPSRGALKRARRLRERAAELQQRAIALEREGEAGRSLNFLAGIQLVGFAVGIAGGWLFSEATPLRVARLRARAARLRAFVNSVVEDEAGAAGEAYGHFQSELAVRGIDVYSDGPPDFDLENRLLQERYLPLPTNGRVPEPETTGGGV